MKFAITHKIVYRAAAIAALSLLLVGRILSVHSSIRPATGPYGRFTVEQILQRSYPLCSAMVCGTESESQPLRLSGSRLLTWTRGNVGQIANHIWVVDAVDSLDKFKVHLVWNGDSGELISASRPADVLALNRDAPMLKQSDAQRITASWLTTLGMSEFGYGWQLESTPVDMEYVWRFKWRTHNREVAVTIDSHTGELIMAQTMKYLRPVGRSRFALGTVLNGKAG